MVRLCRAAVVRRSAAWLVVADRDPRRTVRTARAAGSLARALASGSRWWIGLPQEAARCVRARDARAVSDDRVALGARDRLPRPDAGCAQDARGGVRHRVVAGVARPAGDLDAGTEGSQTRRAAVLRRHGGRTEPAGTPAMDRRHHEGRSAAAPTGWYRCRY